MYLHLPIYMSIVVLYPRPLYHDTSLGRNLLLEESSAGIEEATSRVGSVATSLNSTDWSVGGFKAGNKLP